MPPTSSISVHVISKVSRKDGSWRYPYSWPPKPGVDKESDEYKRHSLNGMWWKDKKACKTMSLLQALTTTFPSHAYFVAYRPTCVTRRLNNNLLEFPEALDHIGGCIAMQFMMLDVDHHEAAEDETEAERYERVKGWWYDELEKIEKLTEAHPGLIVYQSKNGYKLLGLLKQPFEIRTKEDLEAWKRQYKAWLAYLKRRFDIYSHGKSTADDLSNFDRFQRVPHDSNRSPLQTEPHEIIGDVAQIGYWDPTLIDSDWPAVKVAKPRPERVSDQEGCLLLQLILNRGTRCEPVIGGAGDWDIECPDVMRHSPVAGKRDYPTKTRLLASPPIGSILCQSSGCLPRANDPKQWLPFFTDEELERAERDLGRSSMVECGPPEHIKELPRGLNPRVSWIIQYGMPDTTFYLDGYSLDPTKDHGKRQSQWLHEVLCGCLQIGMSYEKILGLFEGWGLKSLRLDNRYLRFLLKNAQQSVTLTDPGSAPTIPAHLEDAYLDWCLSGPLKRDSTDDDNRRQFLQLHEAPVQQVEPGQL